MKTTIGDQPKPTPLHPRWASRPYGPLSSPLVAAGDRLIGVAGGTIFALDMYTGQEITRGSAPTPSWPYTLSFTSGDPQVTAAGGTVYFMNGESLIALGLADGSPQAGWTPPTLAQVSSLFAADGRVIAVYLDPFSGATLVSAYHAPSGTPAFGPLQITTESAGGVAYGSGAVFFVASGALNAVNVDFGDVRWRATPAGDILDPSTPPLIAGGTAVVPGGSLHGVDVITGRIKWTLPASSGAPTPWSTPAAAVDTAVASNGAGDVVAFSLRDGHIVWQTKVTSPGSPVIVDTTVYVPTDGGTRLAWFNALTGASLGPSFALRDTTGQPAVIGNGTIYLADDSGEIAALPFAAQAAASFDGSTSRIDVHTDEGQFDFGTGDFTVEAWFRSSVGGEILSSYPTRDAHGHGIRLNLSPRGQIRVAVTNANATMPNRGRTNATDAADGEWHHVALVRRSGGFVVVLDGTSMPVRLPDAVGPTLAIGGGCGLTIGAFMPSAGGRPNHHFRGLIREVRIWDRALDVATIANNLKVELTGAEPRLRGLWRLDEVQTTAAPLAPRNAVPRHRATANFVNAASVPTDLVMDRSAFPYLLHESRAQWPYAGTWAARGETPATGSPAVSTGNVVAFATNDAIYGVDGHDGTRLWSMDVSEAAAGPVADGNGFLVLTKEESLVRLDARTGAKTPIPAFGGDTGGLLASPAASGTYLAAATGGDNVRILDRGTGTAGNVHVGGSPAKLVFGAEGLLVLSGAPAARQLTLIDPQRMTTRGTVAVQGDAFCTVGGSVIVSRNGAVVKLDARNLALGAPLATSAALPGRITGVVASIDDDVLVAVTDAGIAYGMTLGRLVTIWRTALPAGPAGGSNAVNPPVLDAGGRVVCTTASGTLAFLDARAGTLVGLYGTNRGAVGTPAVAAGTLYTGCDDAPADDASADCDGALHSVVFGETMALRLNLDEIGQPVPAGTQHAVVDAETADATLHLLGVHESCVEAWVNIPALTGAEAARAGGGILGICPTGDSGFDVNLWVDADGTLHYASRTKDQGTWGGVHVRAASSIVDGQWHHIAASRSPAVAPAAAGAPDRVVLYVDGHAVTTTADTSPPPPTGSLVGLKAYIGAIAADDASAARPFVGMIGEVRVWDTYLVSSEIGARMHVKLRGDEPDLLAYWNFDLESVHDSARQNHDGTLAATPTVPVWWLTDLPFTQPSYPYITTAATITAQAEGKPTTYDVTVKVCRADGSGFGRQDVHLWYVKHSADDPSSIVVNTTPLQSVNSDDEPDSDGTAAGPKRVYVGTTASDGTLQLSVVTTLSGHGPALDLWTAFMPANERFHVNVLLDNQTLAKPTPPTLTAQAKLIQDYHYTTGNKIDDTRDRSTWRVVLRAAEANHRPRPKEPIAVWASTSTAIEVQGTAYEITPDNPAALTAENSGELTIVLTADGLTAPTLYARAGFMHRNDRIVISPDQDTHAQLSTMQSSDLTTPRVTNWKKNGASSDGEPLLSSDYHAQAPQIAEAVRHVTATTKPADPSPSPAASSGTPSPALRKLTAMRVATHGTATPALGEMRQHAPRAAADRLVLRRTLAGTPRRATLNPDALRESLGGHLGFVFETTNPKSFRYRLLATQADVDREREPPTPPLRISTFGFFGDLWDDIKDAATDLYNGAVKVVVTIADTVTAAITTMVDNIAKVVHTVISTVEDAINAVVGFFNQLLVGIMKLIAFLRALFDWLAIIHTHRILHDMFKASIEVGTQALRDTRRFTDALATVTGARTGAAPAGGQSLNATASDAGGADSPVVAQANSVQGKSVLQRATSSPARSTTFTGGAAPEPTALAVADPVEVLLKLLPALATDLLDLSPGDLVSRLQSIVGADSVNAARQTIATGMAEMTDALQWAIDAVDATIDIPFISELYRWITGDDLTILDLFCLALAVPVNLAYVVMTLIIHGDPRVFADDAGELADNLKDAAAAPRAPVALARPSPMFAQATTVPDTPLAPEIAFMVFRVITVAMDTVVDMVFTERAPLGDPISPDGVLKIAYHWQGLGGVIYLSLQTFASAKAFEARLKAVTGDDAGDFLPSWPAFGYVVYALQVAARAAKLRYTIGDELGLSGGPSRLGALYEKVEYPLFGSLAVVAADLIVYDIIQLAVLKPKLDRHGNSHVTTEFVLLATRDLLSLSTMLFDWMYTKEGSANIRRAAPGAIEAIYQTVTGIRLFSNDSSIVLHGVAVFGFGK